MDLELRRWSKPSRAEERLDRFFFPDAGETRLVSLAPHALPAKTGRSRTFDHCQMADALSLQFDYQHEPACREAFHRFAESNFPGISFREWDALGGWDPRYRVASIFHGAEVVANASISSLDVRVQGRPARAIQFATVGTLPAWRHRGLSARLMRAWLDQLDGSADFFFLFGNETVLDFYPRFGFRRVVEHRFRAGVDWPAGAHRPRRLDVRKEQDRHHLEARLAERVPVTSTFSCDDYAFIVLFHLLHAPTPLGHVVQSPEALVMAQSIDGVLHVYDVITAQPVSLATLLPQIVSEPVREVVFHFTPDTCDLSTQPEPVGDDSPLFVRGPFPLEGTPFKFPALAQT